MPKISLLPLHCLAGGLLSFQLLVGCGGPNSAPETTDKTDDQQQQSNNDDAGDHHAAGPHQGLVTDLGNGEYHAELVYDAETKQATVYLLDKDAAKPVSIDAAEVIINLKHDGKPTQIKLAAAPQEDDSDAQSSRFVSDDEAASELHNPAAAEAQLVVKIGKKSYRGQWTAGHAHGPDDVHISAADVKRPKDYADAVARIKSYRDSIRDEIAAGRPTKAHRPMDELTFVLKWLPEIASDSNIPKQDHAKIKNAAVALRDSFEKVHANIDAGKDADYKSIAADVEREIKVLEAATSNR